MTETTTNTIEAPATTGYIVRIIEPTDVTSTMETRPYPTLDEARQTVTQLSEKLNYNSVREFLIHVVNQSTGGVEETFQRKIRSTPMNFRNGVLEEPKL